MNAEVTHYDREYLEAARRFLEGAQANHQVAAVLASFGFSKEQCERGTQLAEATARAFEWEEAGTAWNFLSPTVERRIAEARSWYRDDRQRYRQRCFRAAEEEAGWRGVRQASRWPLHRKLVEGTWLALRHTLQAFSFRALLEHRAELRRNLERARQQPPSGAPPPKDTALAELGGWYERWRLLAQRVFRQHPELLAALGLTAGRAAPRLRAPRARAEFGESAAAELLRGASRVSRGGPPAQPEAPPAGR